MSEVEVKAFGFTWHANCFNSQIAEILESKHTGNVYN